jgi:Mrp family chromosome partitioning ATPase
MSRTFRIISGGQEPNDPRPSGSAQGIDPFAASAIPFVEIGGPEGMISSVGRPTVRPVSLHQPPAAAAVTPAPTTVPIATPLPKPSITPVEAPLPAQPLAPSRVLSVTFHRFPKQGLRVMDYGVAPEIVAYHFPDHPVSAEYRLVRDEILKQYEQPGPKVAVFTASAATSGTTTVLLNCAVTLAQDHGHRVLLLDANFSRPGVARRLSASETPGLAEVLGQTLPLAWALQPTPVLNLHVLATGSATDATESHMNGDFPRLLTQLRQWFDWVVVDAGVWSDFPAAEGTVANSDGIYLVARETDIDRPDFTALRTDIASGGGAVRGYISTRQ